jgi:hypothetical protein
MSDREEEIAAGRPWRWLRQFALLIALIFLIAFTAGFVAAHLDSGGSFKPLAIGILAVAALAIAGCGWMLVRQARTPTGEEPLTRKERRNRNLLVGSGVLGAVIALALIFSQEGGVEAAGGVFSSAPLPPWLALGLMLLIGVLLPIISVMWHRTVDEQEADAYKTGALYGFYVYSIGAPLWWLAWRGGFVPEPSGVIIFFVTVLTVGAVWTVKKYG